MAIKTNVRMGGAAGSATKNYTPQIPLWTLNHDGGHVPLLDAGMKFENGSSCQFQFVLDDDSNLISTYGTEQIAAHNVVTISEDAPGYEAWLGRGRISGKDVYRGEAGARPIAVSWRVTVDDGNADLKGLALTAAWVRGVETGRARILAALAAFCNGSPRLTTVIATHLVVAGGEVSMPAKTYPAGTDLTEILEDCAGVEGKSYGVVIHHLASASHLCFLYRDSQDYTSWVSTLNIDDQSPNLTTSFPPIWDQGAAAVYDGGDLLTGMVSRYGTGEGSFVYVGDITDIDRYDYWVQAYQDDVSVSATQAANRAASIRHTHSIERVTQQVTIKLPASKVDQLCAGMTISIRSATSMGGENLGLGQPRQIAQLKWEPIAPKVGAVEGYYYAHMQLDRPLQVVASRAVRRPTFDPPCEDFAGVASLGAAADDDGANYLSQVVTGPRAERVELTLTRSVAVGQSIVCIVGHNHNADPATAVWDSAGNTYTLAAEHRKPVSGGQPRVLIFYSNITSALSAGQKLYWEVDVGASLITTQETESKAISAYLFNATLTSAAESGTGSGFNSTPSVSVGGTAGLLVAGLINKEGASGTPDVITNDPDWTAFTQAESSTTLEAVQVAGGFRINDTGGETWSGTIDQSRDWAMVGAIFGVAACTPDTSAVGSESTDGTSSAPAHADHTHEARTIVRKNSTGSDLIRRRVNLIEGSNVTLTVADDAANNEIDVTIASSGGGSGPTIVRKTANETVNNSSVLQNDDHLLKALAANEVWLFEAVLWYTSGATPDIKLAWTVPAGATLAWSTLNGVNAAGASWEGGAAESTSGTARDFASGAGTRLTHVVGYVANGATAGNLQLQWAQNTANASDTIMLANSILRATLLA